MGSMKWRAAAALISAFIASVAVDSPSSAQPAGSPAASATSQPSTPPSTPLTPLTQPSSQPLAPALTQALTQRLLTRGSDNDDRIGERCQRAARALLKKKRMERHPTPENGSSAQAPLTADQEADIKWLEGNHLECLDPRTGLTAGATDIGNDILRSVAQVVMKRAERAGWEMLRDSLRKTARCDEPTPAPPAAAWPTFPATCGVLSTIPIRDLVSSPGVLIDATILDFLQMVRAAPNPGFPTPAMLERALSESSARWRQGDLQGLASALRQVLSRAVKDGLEPKSCDLVKSIPDKALWVIGMCMIEVQNVQNFDTCDASGWAEMCAPTASVSVSSDIPARLLQIWSLGGRALATRQPTPVDLVKMTFAMADLEIDDTKPGAREAHAYVEALRAFFLGITDKDWIEASTGAVRLVRILGPSRAACSGDHETEACQKAMAADQLTERLFTVLAAVGSYAESYAKSSGDAAAASAAREKIIEDLVDRMVNRTDRRSGVVVSLGGNIGLFGGVRTDFDEGVEAGFPLQVGLGLGVQTYGDGTGGFHAALTAVDLGQYVSLGGGDLKVDSPSIQSALSLGLTVGGWIALRETPLYIGVYGGMSPFVRSDSAMTYQLGAVSGLYLPLLDFN